MTRIMKCARCCTHPAQDRLHGAGLRLHNWSPKKEAWRCTVCLALTPGKADKP